MHECVGFHAGFRISHILPGNNGIAAKGNVLSKLVLENEITFFLLKKSVSKNFIRRIVLLTQF